VSVFADEWRDCLREHYKDVIRNRDHATEKSLVSVMYEVGFSERDLAELRVLATMHIDSVADDFVPDLDALEVEEPTIHAVALPEVEEVEVHEEEIVEVEPTEKAPEDEEAVQADIPESESEDDPQQLSLF
jgi:hypothetical protein